ncbi:MAG: hypothetical protein DRG39_08590 [Deltaproteobacteria bacterium]|nr:MAG: hypothetical protein DRG39_08590 [Deltaproteobacteria bacterium]
MASMLRKQNGSVVVEFALLLPLLLLILSLIIEYGWYFTNWIELTNAVSAGARAGIKAEEWEGEDPKDLAENVVNNNFWDPLQVGVTEEDSPRRIIVTATYKYKALMGPFTESLIPQTIKSSATMVFP